MSDLATISPQAILIGSFPTEGRYEALLGAYLDSKGFFGHCDRRVVHEALDADSFSRLLQNETSRQFLRAETKWQDNAEIKERVFAELLGTARVVNSYIRSQNMRALENALRQIDVILIHLSSDYFPEEWSVNPNWEQLGRWLVDPESNFATDAVGTSFRFVLETLECTHCVSTSNIHLPGSGHTFQRTTDPIHGSRDNYPLILFSCGSPDADKVSPPTGATALEFRRSRFQKGVEAKLGDDKLAAFHGRILLEPAFAIGDEPCSATEGAWVRDLSSFERNHKLTAYEQYLSVALLERPRHQEDWSQRRYRDRCMLPVHRDGDAHHPDRVHLHPLYGLLTPLWIQLDGTDERTEVKDQLKLPLGELVNNILTAINLKSNLHHESPSLEKITRNCGEETKEVLNQEVAAEKDSFAFLVLALLELARTSDGRLRIETEELPSGKHINLVLSYPTSEEPALLHPVKKVSETASHPVFMDWKSIRDVTVMAFKNTETLQVDSGEDGDGVHRRCVQIKFKRE